jgi:O-antigen/teichoic acid export membrane protein
LKLNGLEEQPAEPISAIATQQAGQTSSAPSLGRHTAHGFIWMLIQTLVTKGTGMLGQIALAWYLSPHDFKLVGLTYAVSSFPNLIRDAGLQTILVQRQRHLNRWIGPVFWMSFVLGLAAAGVLVAIAPLAARMYGQAQLTGLINVVAVGSLVSAMGTVPSAIVQIQLRFRLQAVLSLISALLMTAMSVVMAYRGWGAYSYIIPMALTNGLRSAALWVFAPGRIRWRLYLRRWRFILGDSTNLIINGFISLVITQSASLVLGLFHRNDDAVGIFYFAFNLSWQILVILTINMGGVLFPALSKLQHDPQRQVRAYLRSATMLALVGIPACFLQAAVARPGFHLLFRFKWDAAIPVMQVLCLAVAIRTVGITWLFMNASQGRFKLETALNSCVAAGFLISVAVGAKIGGALAVATTQAIFFAFADPIAIYVALRVNGPGAFRSVLGIFRVPLLAGAVAVSAGALAGRAVGTFRGANVVQIAVITLVSCFLYVLLIRKFAAEDWKGLVALVRRRTAA